MRILLTLFFLLTINTLVVVKIHQYSLYVPYSPCAFIRNASWLIDGSIQSCIWECVREYDCQTAVYYHNEKICSMFTELESAGSVLPAESIQASVICYRKNHHPVVTCSSTVTTNSADDKDTSTSELHVETSIPDKTAPSTTVPSSTTTTFINTASSKIIPTETTSTTPPSTDKAMRTTSYTGMTSSSITLSVTFPSITTSTATISTDKPRLTTTLTESQRTMFSEMTLTGTGTMTSSIVWTATSTMTAFTTMTSMWTPTSLTTATIVSSSIVKATTSFSIAASTQTTTTLTTVSTSASIARSTSVITATALTSMSLTSPSTLRSTSTATSSTATIIATTTSTTITLTSVATSKLSTSTVGWTSTIRTSTFIGTSTTLTTTTTSKSTSTSTISTTNMIPPNLLANPGAENGVLPPWVVDGSGTPTVDDGFANSGYYPQSGNKQFYGGSIFSGFTSTLTQSVLLLNGTQGYTAVQLDSGTLTAYVSFYEQSYPQISGTDEGRIKLAFRTLNNTLLSDASSATYSCSNWCLQSYNSSVPNGTRVIDYTMVFQWITGFVIDSYFDDNSLMVY